MVYANHDMLYSYCRDVNFICIMDDNGKLLCYVQTSE